MGGLAQNQTGTIYVNNKIWNAIYITFVVILLNIRNFQVATKTQRIDLPAIALAQAPA
jgi:hypothetical protein